MPIRRMGRPGLIGVAARTAVVAGTASAVVGHQQRKNQAAAAPAEPAPAPAPAPEQVYAEPEASAPTSPDLLQQIEQLSGLHTAGVLSDEEFAAAKAKLLA